MLRGTDSVPSYSDVYFYVNPTSGVLYVTKRLSEDTQRPSRYVLSITAFDNGIPQLSGRVTVTVNVIRNRNGPVFSGNSYETTVDESISTGTSILQVQATDADGVSTFKMKKEGLFCNFSLRMIYSRILKLVTFDHPIVICACSS